MAFSYSQIHNLNRYVARSASSFRNICAGASTYGYPAIPRYSKYLVGSTPHNFSTSQTVLASQIQNAWMDHCVVRFAFPLNIGATASSGSRKASSVAIHNASNQKYSYYNSGDWTFVKDQHGTNIIAIRAYYKGAYYTWGRWYGLNIIKSIYVYCYQRNRVLIIPNNGTSMTRFGHSNANSLPAYSSKVFSQTTAYVSAVIKNKTY